MQSLPSATVQEQRIIQQAEKDSGSADDNEDSRLEGNARPSDLQLQELAKPKNPSEIRCSIHKCCPHINAALHEAMAAQ